MDAGEFTDEDFFRTVSASGARVLIIGRRALILLGAPVMTSDYDVWLHIDDIEKLNAAFKPFDHVPNRSAADARQSDRYVLENGEHVDVLVARTQSDSRGKRLDFDGVWSRKQSLEPLPGIEIHLPNIDDLIATKRWASRPRDIIDIQWLETLRRSSE